MNRSTFAAPLSLAVLVAVAAAAQPVIAAQPPAVSRTRLDPSDARPQWRPGQVVVKFKDGVRRPAAAAVHSTLGGRVVRRIPGAGAEVVRLPAGAGVLDAVDAYNANPAVAYAEPNLLRFPATHDTQYAQQWGLNNTAQSHPASYPGGTFSGTAGADIDAPEAWASQTGSPNTVIAVLDSGVDVNHVDLNGNLWTNPGETPGNATDDDGNGKVDDVFGWDFAGDDATLIESDTTLAGWDHGTHVAGIIAAEHDGAGITGVCPGCRVMVLKFMFPYDCDQDGTLDCVVGDLASELAAIAYAKQKGADIINASFGQNFYFTKSERSAIASAGAAGILFVAAAGNSNGDNDLFAAYDIDGDNAPDSQGPAYPASYNLSTILAVAASNHHDQLGYNTACANSFGGPGFPCTFTNWGYQSVDVAAPGVDVLSTIPGNAYDAWDGTSMATPMVAGVAGLVESAHPGYTPGKIKNAIMNSVDKPTNLKKLYAFTRADLGQTGSISGSWMRTNGRVDAFKALTGSTTNATPLTDGNINGAASIATSRSNSLRWPGDINDVYKKKLYKNATYRVVLNGPGNQDFDLIIMDPGSTDIWQYDASCDVAFGASACKFFKWPFDLDADTSMKFKAPATGVYYLHIANYTAGGNYTLTVKRV